MFCTHVVVFSREYAATIPRPFAVKYNPYTMSVEVIESKAQILDVARNIKCKLIEVNVHLIRLYGVGVVISTRYMYKVEKCLKNV